MTNKSTTNVSVDIVTNEQFLRTIGGGGVKVLIDGRRLNRYCNEENRDWSDWRPEYEGTDLATDLWNLITTTTTILDERVVFDEHFVDFNEYRSGIVLEYLGEDTLRIAFRVAEPAHEGEEIRRAVPESACGYPVDAVAWAEALLDAGEEFRDRLVELEYDVRGEEGTFDPILNTLRAQLPQN